MAPVDKSADDADADVNVEFKVPPTAGYLLTLDEDQYNRYLSYLESFLDGNIMGDFGVLMDVNEHSGNAEYFHPLIVKLLNYGGYSVPQYDDSYEFMFYLHTDDVTQKNVCASFIKFIGNDDNFEPIFNDYMKSRGFMYVKYFTDNLIKIMIKKWLTHLASDIFIIVSSDALDIFEGNYHLTDTSVNEAMLYYIRDVNLLDDILFCNFKE
jgi:hypothetical protein